MQGGLLYLAYYTADGVIHYPSTTAAQTQAHSNRVLDFNGVLQPCQKASTSVFGATMLSVPAPTFALPLAVVETLEVSAAPPVASFNDVPTNHPFFQFIEALKVSGITAGCQAAPPLYCPDNPLTRGQMAVFLAKALGL